MKRLTVRLRAEANQNLKDIYDWIVVQSGYPQIAEKLIDRIFDACDTLGEFPMKGRARNDLKQGVRILPFERVAIIAYRILGDEVEVLNVFYKGRDYETSLIDDG
ncbi:MAG: type II toxin-antitoxin system RelE/ParE family toxin [Aestuariivirga sp.]